MEQGRLVRDLLQEIWDAEDNEEEQVQVHWEAVFVLNVVKK
jgi:hypothetical protein